MGQRMLLLLLAGSLVGCRPSVGASWAIYPLPHHAYHDELAVVNQPDAFGLHIWLETTQASLDSGYHTGLRVPLAHSTATGAHLSARVWPSGRSSSRLWHAPMCCWFSRVGLRPSVPPGLLRGAEGNWVAPPPSLGGGVDRIPAPARGGFGLPTDPDEERRRQEALLEVEDSADARQPHAFGSRSASGPEILPDPGLRIYASSD